MNKKGFTLIELLAVIVILAIIALIATPVILGIITDAKEESNQRSIELYADSIKNTVVKYQMKNNESLTGTYEIMADGNICLEYQDNDKTKGCIEKLIVEVDGNKPTTGQVTIYKDGNIYLEGTKLNGSDKEYIQGIKQYTIGEEVTFDPGDGDRTWNVIDQDSKTVTLLMTENLGDPVEWYKDEQIGATNGRGPKTVLEYLNSLTINWKNVDPIDSYEYINRKTDLGQKIGYFKLEIKDGKATVVNLAGSITEVIEGISRARILSIEELVEIASKTNENLTEKNLRAYIERNLNKINEKLNISATTVDEIIDIIVPKNFYDNKYFLHHPKIENIVAVLQDNYGIETTYNIDYSEYLRQNLYAAKKPYGYWILTSSGVSSDNAYVVVDLSNEHDYAARNVEEIDKYGIRPVITISKSKVLR